MSAATLLVVGHGSREPAGNAEIEQFAAQWRLQHPQWHIELCFIEFADVLLPAGLANAAHHAMQQRQVAHGGKVGGLANAAHHAMQQCKQGKAERVRVVVLPLILNAASHVKSDIPLALAAVQQQYRQVQFVCAPHLGACDEVLAILCRRLEQSMQALGKPEPQSTGVILLGRGSSDRHANGEVAQIARWLLESGTHELVDVAFTGITQPRLERVVQRQVQLGMRQIVVLPYYLFNGVLIQRIGLQIQQLQQQYPHIRFAQGNYLGFEPEICRMLERSVIALSGQ